MAARRPTGPKAERAKGRGRVQELPEADADPLRARLGAFAARASNMLHSMTRTSTVAAFALFALAAVAAADEYTVTTLTAAADRVYVTPPPLPGALDLNPQSVELVLDKNVDAHTAEIDLPFTFPFFGRLYDKISVSDDGWLSFGATQVVKSANPTLPNTDPPNAVVAALWDRLATRRGDVVTFFRKDATVAPNRVFVVAWQNVNLSDAHARDALSFEVLLHEGTGVVEIAYSTRGRWSKLSYTAGIENETGTRAFGGPTKTNTNFGRPAADQRFTPNVVAVTGKVTRNRPAATASGLGAFDAADLPVLPVVGADVQLVREDTSDVIATTRTDANGAFTMQSFGLDGSPTFAVDLLASGAESKVTDGTGATWKRRIASGLVPVGAVAAPDVFLDKSADVASPNFRKALNIEQAAQRGFAFAQAAIDASGKDAKPARKAFAQLEIRFVGGSGVPSGYTPAGSSTPAQMLVSDADANSDAYDDFVILREYSQHLLAQMTGFAGKLQAHVWTQTAPTPPTPEATPPTETAAFLDGFSFWFAAAVQGDAKFLDTTTPPAGATAVVFDLEAATPTLYIPKAGGAPHVAGAVAATLWDLVDPADDDAYVGSLPATAYAMFVALDDRVADRLGASVAIPSGTAAPTIETFFEKWRPSAADPVKAARVFIAHKTLPDDDFEPNDVATDPAPAFKADQGSTQKMSNLVLNESNTDRFTFVLSDTPLSLAVSFAESTQVEATIRDPANADAAIALAATPSASSPVVVTTKSGQTAGTYVLQIVWISGPAAHYAISTFTPPSLKKALPTKWTVGLPFNSPLEEIGGAPPGVFSLASGSAPGLSIQPGGAAFVGTPTTTGSFPLTLSVSDASGAGAQPLPPVTLTILEGLTLPDVFGVAAGRPVAADVGRGGVAPTWVPGSNDVLPPGFALANLPTTDGATLRLTATSDSATAQSFTVSASATDAAPLNATLAAKTSQIVVASSLDAAARTTPDATKPFGFWFDAIAGSRATLSFRFAGASPPTFLTLIDKFGTPVPLADNALSQNGASLRIKQFVAPATSRYFLVFNAADGFKGTVASARVGVRAPARYAGTVDITTTATTRPARFSAIKDSTATIVLRSAAVPGAARPGVISILTPSGKTIGPANDQDPPNFVLPAPRLSPDGSVETYSRVALPENGEYVTTIAGDGASTGPISFEVRITPKPKTAFSAD